MGKWLHRLLSKDIENKCGVCAHCGPVRIRIKGGYWKCQRAVNEHRGDRRYGVNWHHGLTDFEAAAFKKGKRCAICGASSKLTVDHCHATQKVRGVLCTGCNIGLGHFKDDPARLSGAIAYLTESVRIKSG